MIMDEGEIVREYRAAKDGKKQIEILADINCSTKTEIAEILCNNGAISATVLSNYKRTGTKKKSAKKAKTPKVPKIEVKPEAPKAIADSGERREFESGAVRDIQVGKGRCDLLPMCALLRLSRHFEAGAEKYSDRNWEKGIPIHSFMDSALRHLFKYIDGLTDEDHLCAAAWNLLCAMWTEEKHPELRDLPWQIAERENVT